MNQLDQGLSSCSREAEAKFDAKLVALKSSYLDSVFCLVWFLHQAIHTGIAQEENG